MRLFILFLIILLCPRALLSQEHTSGYEKLYSFPDKAFGVLHKKVNRFEEGVLNTSQKYLNKMQRSEEKMKRKLMKKDSVKAQELFGDIESRYENLKAELVNPNSKLPKVYHSKLDSLKTAISFIGNSQENGITVLIPKEFSVLQKDFSDAQLYLNKIEFIQATLHKRQHFLQQQIHTLPLGKNFISFKKNIYYYRDRMDGYKQVLNNSSKVESLLLSNVNKIPAFNSFFANHSALGGLFRLPNSTGFNEALVGSMQTREMIMAQIGERISPDASAQQTLNSSIVNAQPLLQGLKEKINSFQSNGEIDVKDFAPNPEKTKNFFNRLEFGFNLQSVKSNYFLPSTSDLGLSIGYKWTNNIVSGIGLSYKVGWGRSIRNIQFTHEGVGLRSFVDIRWKGSFWLTGGVESNYLSAFKHIEELRENQHWQYSALAGLSKKYEIKNRKGELKLLYDFLWNKNYPATQPLIFRTGFTLK